MAVVRDFHHGLLETRPPAVRRKRRNYSLAQASWEAQMATKRLCEALIPPPPPIRGAPGTSSRSRLRQHRRQNRTLAAHWSRNTLRLSGPSGAFRGTRSSFLPSHSD
jgi:hypothetical protein